MAKIIALSGVVGWDILAQDVRADLKAANGEDVIFELNSPGGFVFEGIEIFNLIRDYEGNTESHIIGLAASMMTYIALAADKVLARDNAAFMIHDALTCVCGNHRDMEKARKWLDGISNIIAKAYVNQTGKSLNEIRALMKEDMFLFGDEMLAEGFVDEIIPASDGEETDKAASILTARASVEMCINKMRISEAANEDYQKAVAYVDSMTLLGTPETVAAVAATDTDTNPAGAGNKKQEDKRLKTLAELLVENPSAKAEHDVLIAKARTEGATAAKDEMKEVVDRISPKLMSGAYGDDVKEAGIKAIIGTGPEATFETLVVLADRDAEKLKAEAAKKETEKIGDTPGASGEKLTDEEAAAEFKKKKDDVKAQGGF